MLVLLIEDSETFAEFIAHWLEDAGLTVTIAPSMSRAEDVLASQEPDLILLDLNLPCMSGLQTYNTCRRLAPTIETIILTGDEDKEVKEKAKSDGIKYIIKDPLSLTDKNALFIEFLLARIEVVQMRRLLATPQNAVNGGLR